MTILERNIKKIERTIVVTLNPSNLLFRVVRLDHNAVFLDRDGRNLKPKILNGRENANIPKATTNIELTPRAVTAEDFILFHGFKDEL